jgi:hypothetical protein
MLQHKRGPAPLPTERTGPNGFGELKRSLIGPIGDARQGAYLHPRWIGGKKGYVYDVHFHLDLIVEGSSDPEFDVARALLAKGITGSITILDGITGKPRTIIRDISKAAGYCTREGPLRFENLSLLDRAPTGETRLVGRMHGSAHERAGA